MSVARFTALEASSPAMPGDYWELLKPRVMSLVVFTGIVGLLLAPGSIHPLFAFVAILCIAVGSGAAGAINMWYDRDIDALMERTSKRPLPQGRVAAGDALTFGVMMAAGSVLVMGVVVNWIAAFYLALAILYYVFIYTIWLKRKTPHNIVIGGAAGAFPPVIGWAAVTGSTTLEPWILFAIIFMWTPPHFWALSLYRNEDYKRAKVPMLPVVEGIQATKKQMMLYTLSLIPLTLAPTLLGYLGWVYGVSALGLSLYFTYSCGQVMKSDEAKPAIGMFVYSIFYLFLLFAAMILDRVADRILL